jgi:hypothetical protein
MCIPLSPIELQKVDLSMTMIMNFRIMAWMVMIMWAVFPGVFMVVCMDFAAVRVLVDVLVEMIMCMGMRVLVAVLHFTV